MKSLKVNTIIVSRRSWIALFTVILIIGAGITFIRVISAPSHGQTTNTISSKFKTQPQRKAVIAPASDIQNTYFSLALPVGYKQQSSSQTVPGLLYQQTIIKPSSSGSLIISISISELGSGLGDNTAYTLRSRDITRYKLTNQIIGSDSLSIANDNQSAAVVAFWPHNSKLATISVSSGLQDPPTDNNANEIKALRPILSAWQWQ